MVRFPTTTRAARRAISSFDEPWTNLFGWNLAISQPDVNSFLPVQGDRREVPDHPNHHDPNHEAQGQGPRHCERGVDGVVEDEHEQQTAEDDDAADPSQDDRWHAENPVPATLFPDLSQSV